MRFSLHEVALPTLLISECHVTGAPALTNLQLGRRKINCVLLDSTVLRQSLLRPRSSFTHSWNLLIRHIQANQNAEGFVRLLACFSSPTVSELYPQRLNCFRLSKMHIYKLVIVYMHPSHRGLVSNCNWGSFNLRKRKISVLLLWATTFPASLMRISKFRF